MRIVKIMWNASEDLGIRQSFDNLSRTKQDWRTFQRFFNPQKENIMNIEDVKQIPIADYLHSLGYSPVKRQGNGLWYKSPLREEHEASFKVNTDRNLWYDFGAGKGGNIIALAKELFFSDSLPFNRGNYII